jgi:hypothetical protein
VVPALHAVRQEAVEIFTGLSHDHIALEEGCIYPQARARLDTLQRHEMGREMALRRRMRRDAGPARDPRSIGS